MMDKAQSLASTTCDVDVPQCGLDNVKGADITFLDPIVRAEPPPAPSELATTTTAIPKHDAMI